MQKEKNISLFSNTTIEVFEITDEFVEISLSNKKQFNAKLIVGSDGRDSFIRNELNIKSTTKALRQNALTFGINMRSHIIIFLMKFIIQEVLLLQSR